jgi:UDP-glucose 4-epimerase
VVGLGHGDWTESEWRSWGLSRWYSCDVDLRGLIGTGEAPDAVVHCAGSGSVGFSMSHPADDCARSAWTLLAVLEFVRVHVPQARVVMPSSAAVYGRAIASNIPVTAPLFPVSPYGVHKWLAEELCRSYGTHFGVSTTIVRFFSLFGTGLRKQLLWDACQRFSRGNATFMGTGLEVRDWLHIADAADLTVVAADYAGPHTPVVNGGTGVG